MKIGFIGMGNMGQALLKGLIKSFPADDIRFTCQHKEKTEIRTDEGSVLSVVSNEELVNFADIIILAIKPQMYQNIFDEIKVTEVAHKIFISLAPGKTIEYISCELGCKRIVRAMPNTPAKIGFGMTGIAYDECLFDDNEIRIIDEIFSSVGEYEKVDEPLISAVVCASGSSPAYVYEFISQLAKSCEIRGLEHRQAIKFVANAVLGAAKMVLESDESPDTLREKVCSKGGTTLAGLEKLEEYGFSKAIEAATEACYNRSEELSK